MAENRETPLSADAPIRQGHALTCPLFGEPTPLETGGSGGPGVWIAALAGKRSEQFRRVTLTTEGISNQTIAVSSQYWRLFSSVAAYQPIQEMLCGGQGVIRRSA